jgi:hypothetical protein
MGCSFQIINRKYILHFGFLKQSFFVRTVCLIMESGLLLRNHLKWIALHWIVKSGKRPNVARPVSDIRDLLHLDGLKWLLHLHETAVLLLAYRGTLVRDSQKVFYFRLKTAIALFRLVEAIIDEVFLLLTQTLLWVLELVGHEHLNSPPLQGAQRLVVERAVSLCIIISLWRHYFVVTKRYKICCRCKWGYCAPGMSNIIIFEGLGIEDGRGCSREVVHEIRRLRILLTEFTHAILSFLIIFFPKRSLTF